MAKKNKIVRLSSSAPSAERIEVWHRKSCSMSRKAMELLEQKKIVPEVFLYSEVKVTEADIKSVLKKLGISAEELIRKKEDVYKENFRDKKMDEEKWIKAMVKYPILIERPIVIKGNKAVIGRPIERILEVI